MSARDAAHLPPPPPLPLAGNAHFYPPWCFALPQILLRMPWAFVETCESLGLAGLVALCTCQPRQQGRSACLLSILQTFMLCCSLQVC